MTDLPKLKRQEIPFDHPDSCNRFQASPDKPLLATPGAVEAYSLETIEACYRLLNQLAILHGGLDYLQVYESSDPKTENLWFIEDGPGGAITALLQTEY